MPTRLTCPRGHQWEAEASDLPLGGPLTCPVCRTAFPPGEIHRSSLEPSGRTPGESPHTTGSCGNTVGETRPPIAASERVFVAGYEILGELGRGGMGVVYKARQVSLNRLVALKMMRSADPGDSEQLARFRREAEAVARLQHPNIVQIHEVGEHQGKPFFSLELIEGGSLADRLDGTPQPPRAAAELVETLARAMHAAHERGIIHRDLKPGNVLLQGGFTADGEGEAPAEPGARGSAGPQARPPDLSGSAGASPSPSAVNPSSFIPKITDFGLAKRLDEVGQTQSGAVMGTPCYMAPEQAGNNKEVGPATDIYSLGAILYELLTGRPPFKGATSWETIEQVVATEPVPPRRLQPKLPRDLETICLKCLQKKPVQRYASALDLADDLARFLDHRPIRARPVPLWRRGIMWARRRPAVAALAAVSSLAAVVLLVVVVVANAILHHKNDQLQNALADTRQAVADAERERLLAQENFRRALEAADQMLSQVGDGLARFPHMEEERRRILEKALKFFQEFLRQNSRDPVVRQEAGWAYRRTARIYELLGQDRRAEQDLQRAAALQEELAEQFPDVPEYSQDLAATINALGLLYRMTRPAEAEPAIRRALAIYERLNREYPEQFLYRFNLGVTRSNLAVAAVAAGRNDLAEKEGRNALDCWEALIRDYPKQIDCRTHLANGYNTLGALYQRLGRWKEARMYFERALPVQERLAADEPDEPAIRHDLAKTYHNLAIVLANAGLHEKVDHFGRKARKVLQKLVDDFPAVLEYRDMLGSAYMNFALHLEEVGEPKRALAAFEKARALAEELVHKQPNSLGYQHSLARALGNLGLLAWQLGHRRQAEKANQQALLLWQGLVRADPRSPEFQEGLAAIHLNLGMIAHATNQLPQAETAFRKALELWQELDRRSAHRAAQRGIAKCYFNLAVVSEDQGQTRQALEANQKALTLLEELVKREPHDADHHADLAKAHRNRCRLLLRKGQPDQAEAELRKAINVHKRLASLYPKDSPYQATLAKKAASLATKHLASVGDGYNQLNRLTAARKAYREALAAVEPLARAHPDDLDYQYMEAVLHYNLGSLARKGGWAGAEASFKKLARMEKALLAPGEDRPQRVLLLVLGYLALGELASQGKPLDAMDWYKKGIEILRDMLRQENPPADATPLLGSLYTRRAEALVVLNRHEEALADVDRAIRLEKGPPAGVLPYLRAAILVRLGKHAQAIADANKAAGKDPTDGFTLYNLACVHALASASARKDDKLEAAQRDKTAEQYAARAVELLEKARSAGHFKTARNVGDLKDDADLESLRSREDFKRLCRKVEK